MHTLTGADIAAQNPRLLRPGYTGRLVVCQPSSWQSRSRVFVCSSEKAESATLQKPQLPPPPVLNKPGLPVNGNGSSVPNGVNGSVQRTDIMTDGGGVPPGNVGASIVNKVPSLPPPPALKTLTPTPPSKPSAPTTVVPSMLPPKPALGPLSSPTQPRPAANSLNLPLRTPQQAAVPPSGGVNPASPTGIPAPSRPPSLSNPPSLSGMRPLSPQAQRPASAAAAPGSGILTPPPAMGRQPNPSLAPPPSLAGPPSVARPPAAPGQNLTLKAPPARPSIPMRPNLPSPPTTLQRPTLAPPPGQPRGLEAKPPPQYAPKPDLKQPPSRPDGAGVERRTTESPSRGDGRQGGRTRADAATTSSGLVLNKPNAPPLRVLDTIFNNTTPQIEIEEVVEDEDGVLVVDDDEEAKPKKVRKGRKEKVTAEMKRKAKKQREEAREEKARSSARDREEIFEVGNEGMSLADFAYQAQLDESDIVRTLFMKGIMVNSNQILDKNTVKLVGQEFDFLVVDKEEASVSEGAKRKNYLTEEDIDEAVPRPPVVTVMGHVDHGKTSLLDAIRKARVADGEAGGITQAIGAYNTTVKLEDGEEKTICFLDTPGHEAFSAMRARGASVTDMAIIIVAADDGVRPQTREAVMHAQAADVPIIVAINKADKQGADPERVKQELLELNLVPEEWGGKTPMVVISAKKGTGIDDLLQNILWVAEEQQYVANPAKRAEGTVIESHLDKKVGPVATVLVQCGTLRVGDIVRAGASLGKVRNMINDLGRSVDTAGPSIAVQLFGLDSTPVAGEEFRVYSTDSEAREAAMKSAQAMRNQRMADLTGGGSMVTLSTLATMDEDVDVMQRMNLIVKGDTMGVVEAIKGALSSLPQESVTLRFLLSGAGDITVSDVDLAAASQGLILGFNIEPDEAVQTHAKRMGVTINSYKVIYNLLDDVKAAMEGKLRSVQERVNMGKAVVKAVFGTGKKRVAGCAVTEGKLQKGTFITVKRGKAVVFDGKLSSLRRVKDVVDEVSAGLECGVAAEGFVEWQADDQIECYKTVTKARRLEDAKAATAVDAASLA